MAHVTVMWLGEGRDRARQCWSGRGAEPHTPRVELWSYICEALPGLSTAAAEARPGVGQRAEAPSQHGDVIVIASHGRSGMRRWMLGSVAEKLVRLAEAAVLIVRTKATADA